MLSYPQAIPRGLKNQLNASVDSGNIPKIRGIRLSPSGFLRHRDEGLIGKG